jgi:hypothetical protein
MLPRWLESVRFAAFQAPSNFNVSFPSCVRSIADHYIAFPVAGFLNLGAIISSTGESFLGYIFVFTCWWVDLSKLSLSKVSYLLGALWIDPIPVW